MAGGLDYLKSLGLSVARGVPQMATGMVDLAALPFTMSGLLKSEDAVGSTDWMTKKGLLPPPQKGLLNQTTELLSGAVNPAAAAKAGLVAGAGIFAGKGAKTADAVKLALAEKLDAAGTDARKIWQDTGWFKGVDGKWRFEIDDSRSLPGPLSWGDKIDVKRGSTTTTNRQRALIHPQLSAAYPESKDIPVILDPNNPGRGGVDRYGSLDIIKAPVDKNTMMSDRSVMLHELQHVIQNNEGFALGGSPDMPQLSKYFSPDIMKRRNEHFLKAQDLMERGLFREANAEMTQANEVLKEARYDAYRRLAGEAEARAVQTRMNMPPALRKQIFPLDTIAADVPLDKLIVDGLLGSKNGGLLGEARPPKSADDLVNEVARLKQVWSANPTAENKAAYLTARRLRDDAFKGVDMPAAVPGAADDYRGAHTAPTRSSGGAAFDLTTVYPEDIYGKRGADYYGHFGGDHPMDQRSISILQSLRGKPDATVEIYRAVPKNVNSPINPGDWVTINKDYARDHGESQFGKDYKILKSKVKASDIFTNGDSIHEFGYDPKP